MTLRLCILLLLVAKMVLTLCNLCWCSFLVVPLVYAHIQMTCFVWWLLSMVVIVCSVPCVCACVCVFTVRSDYDVCVCAV